MNSEVIVIRLFQEDTKPFHYYGVLPDGSETQRWAYPGYVIEEALVMTKHTSVPEVSE